MKDYKGIVFFDYDGMLIDEVDGIFDMPDSTKEALIKLRENGYAVCVCTGRTKQFSEDVKEYFNGYVTGMGAYVEIDGEIIQSIEITEAEIESLRQLCAPPEIFLCSWTERLNPIVTVWRSKATSFSNMCSVSETTGYCHGIQRINVRLIN